jgi:uncharacterized protein YndB with AHSA1/START domain
MNTTFVYVTFIRTTQEKLWDALTRPEFTRAYWYGAWHDTNWQRGSPWKLMIPDGRVGDSGEILEIEKPHRLVLKWKNEFRSELREEGYSRCTLELEAQGETVKLTVSPSIEREDSKFIEGVSGGWPRILSSLKSFLETGKAHEATTTWPK